jgi:hypothetical protein
MQSGACPDVLSTASIHHDGSFLSSLRRVSPPFACPIASHVFTYKDLDIPSFCFFLTEDLLYPIAPLTAVEPFVVLDDHNAERFIDLACCGSTCRGQGEYSRQLILIQSYSLN